MRSFERVFVLATSMAAVAAVGTAPAAQAAAPHTGDDRYLTSSAVSHKLWADATGDVGTTSRRPAKAVVPASGAGFADALDGVPTA